MTYFRLILVILVLFTFSAKANDVKIINLHNNKSLDQLVLEKENIKNEQNNIENIEDEYTEDNNTIVEESNIIEVDEPNLDKIDNENSNIESVDEQIVYIENETFFELDNSIISIYLDKLKNIQSKTLHREFINILSSIDLEDKNIYDDKVYFVIKKLYEMGEIEKAYNLVMKINLESANIDK